MRRIRMQHVSSTQKAVVATIDNGADLVIKTETNAIDLIGDVTFSAE